MQDGLLRYPVRGPGGVETLLIGGGLHLLAVYLPLAPLVPVVGYLSWVLVHTASDTAAGRRGAPRLVTFPPTRRGLVRLAVDGLRGTVVLVAYLTPAVVVAAVTARGVRRVTATGGIDGATGGAILVGGMATLLVTLAFCYPLPAALAAVGRRRRLAAAADPRLLRRVLTDARYFVGWTVGVVALGVGFGLARPLAPFALGFFVVFYAECVAAASWGWGVSLALDG